MKVSRTSILRALTVLLLAVLQQGLGTLHAASPQNSAPPELSTAVTLPSFRLRVQKNLVLVPVVVRDAKGHTVANLTKDEFQIFDNRKPQIVSQFEVERHGNLAASSKLPVHGQPPAGTLASPAAASLPQRYVALFFDDVEDNFEDLSRTRAAAIRYLATATNPGDRIGIYTTSGQVTQDFTADRDKIDSTLNRLTPRPVIQNNPHDCPLISPYQAYKMLYQNDLFATKAADDEAYQCMCVDVGNTSSNCAATAAQDAEAKAREVYEQSQMQSQYAIRGLKTLIVRMRMLPGERQVVMVSPGFLTNNLEYDVEQIIDSALRSRVIVNTLDARGLYTEIPGGDASTPDSRITDAQDAGVKTQIMVDSDQAQSDVLMELADGTGGLVFQNSNDYYAGFVEAGAEPAVYYILGFSPENLKDDGRFHQIRVKVTGTSASNIQARRGYFAPKKGTLPEDEAKEEIEQAIFSQDKMDQIPVQFHTQFFKVDSTQVKLSVLTHLDLSHLPFRKAAGRNSDDVTLVTAIFDQDGNMVMAKQKTLQFHLLDTSLARLDQSGITVGTRFDVKPGSYMVREVVRDAEGSKISALNGSVEIPY
ncbi:MAG: VWA domain-containing protein [Terriglobia bacterium]